MAYIKFIKDTGVYKASVVPENNIVTIKFDDKKIENTNGFDLYLDKECSVDIGGNTYHSFTTMYRNDETTEAYNGYQLSNDGSVYVDPVPIPEPTISLDDLKEQKVSEMNNTQQSLIIQGVDVKLSDNSTEHFTLTAHDQTSLVGLQSQVASGDDNIPWHTSDEDEHCKFYSNADMAKITSTAMAYVTWHVTYFRDLRIYIRSLTSKEEVEKVIYGMDIPEAYQSEPLKAMMAQKS